MDKYEKYLVHAISAVTEKLDRCEDEVSMYMYREIYDRFIEAFMKYQIYVKDFNMDMDSIDQDILKTDLEDAM